MGKLPSIGQYFGLIYRDDGRWQLGVATGRRSGGLRNGGPATDSETHRRSKRQYRPDTEEPTSEPDE